MVVHMSYVSDYQVDCLKYGLLTVHQLPSSAEKGEEMRKSYRKSKSLNNGTIN